MYFHALVLIISYNVPYGMLCTLFLETNEPYGGLPRECGSNLCRERKRERERKRIRPEKHSIPTKEEEGKRRGEMQTLVRRRKGMN